ncbi:MAG: hypothetical protein IJ239_04300, partial [Eubacterium sp.]|nr:hypothetical protein [Eubacterium sp.]
ADKTGMDPEKLSASVTTYNAVDRGETEDPFGFQADDPADTELTERFLQMGIDELSVSPSMILPVRKQIRSSVAKCD